MPRYPNELARVEDFHREALRLSRGVLDYVPENSAVDMLVCLDPELRALNEQPPAALFEIINTITVIENILRDDADAFKALAKSRDYTRCVDNQLGRLERRVYDDHPQKLLSDRKQRNANTRLVMASEEGHERAENLRKAAISLARKEMRCLHPNSAIHILSFETVHARALYGQPPPTLVEVTDAVVRVERMLRDVIDRFQELRESVTGKPGVKKQ